MNTFFAHRRLAYDIGIGCSDDVDGARRKVADAFSQLSRSKPRRGDGE